jgi:spore coat protein JB
MNYCQQNRTSVGYSCPGAVTNSCHRNQKDMSYDSGNRNPYSCQTQMTMQNQSCFGEKLPKMTQEQLFCYLNQVSFVISDLLLYLDTHPDDQQALMHCRKHISMRKQALEEYARLYGPLTIDTANDSDSESWKWVSTPWPWEGRKK